MYLLITFINFPGYGSGTAQSRGISMDVDGSLVFPSPLVTDTGNYTCVYYVPAYSLTQNMMTRPYHCAHVYMTIHGRYG